MPRCHSHSLISGTIRRAASAFGFVMIPTVSTGSMQKELLVPFGAGDRTFDQRRFETQLFHGFLHFRASRPVQFGVADDTALTDLATAHFKLWFDEYNELDRKSV